ncbi:hypothetical protein RB595_000446 [Gaeumannomyces hyphopodioides]
MEERRQSKIPSALPRPMSRLPQPRSAAPSIRPSASREQLNTGGSELRLPKLRTAASRDRLGSSIASGARKQAPTSTQQPAKPQTRSVSRRTPSVAPSTEPPTESPAPATQQTDVLFKRRLTLTRRPSEVFSHSPITPAKERQDPWSAPVPTETSELEQRAGSRPSLSERTIETLSQLPSSPSLSGKASAFFDTGSIPQSPSRPGSRASRGSGSRPSSSYQKDVQSRSTSRGPSRPPSSSRQDHASMLARPSSAFKTPLAPIRGTPTQGAPAGMKTLRASSSQSRLGAPGSDKLRASARTIPAPGSKMLPPLSRSRTPSPEKQPGLAENSKPAAKTLAARPLKSRQSTSSLFKKPSASAVEKPAAAGTPTARKSSLVSQKSSNTSGDDATQSSSSPTSTVITVDSSESSSMAASSKSSAALREQIAKAKAARRESAKQQQMQQQQEEDEGDAEGGVSASAGSLSQPVKSPLIPTDTTFDFGLADHAFGIPDNHFGMVDVPFGQRRSETAKARVLEARFGTARTSGRLDLAALGLREIPREVLKIYDLASIGTQDGSWAESVDLTRFVAADNEIEMIDDVIFPDRDPHDFNDDEEGSGGVFYGLETLDLHGNMLISLPNGLKRLQCLTSLNLSSNRITNPSSQLISEITSLRDLKLGGNLFYGPLDASFSKLTNLEILDLHGNNISALPTGLVALKKLRILNLSENSFEALPFKILSQLPLTEILARKNKLGGVLVDDSVESLENLQSLDVSSNQLTHLSSPDRTSVLAMPSLHQICVSMNRLKSLPDLSKCPSLLTITADENSISAIPEGLISLASLRHVDLSSNDVRTIPAEIARMDNLAMIRLSGNPLRDKKFCSISTEELKEILASRLAPAEEELEEELEEAAFPMRGDTHKEATRAKSSAVKTGDDFDDSRCSDEDFATPPTSAPHSPARSRSHTLSKESWVVKPGGVLDRSKTESSSLHPVLCSRAASEHRVREVQLHHNLFSVMPESLSFFAETLTSLSLAHNQLVGESYMGDAGSGMKLELLALRELNLCANHITSLVPLISNLISPALQKLDVSANRISALPPGTQLRDAFPDLTVLLVSNNHLVDLEPDSIKGMRVVDASNNDIAHLNPRIGLLGGTGSNGAAVGLEKLDVMGNRFRVPRFNVLERGTEATLRFLRGRIPVAEMAVWKENNKDNGVSHSSDDEVD